MTTKERQKSRGFSPIGIIAIVLVIAAISLSGWFVWNQKDSNKANKNTATSAQSSKQQEQKPISTDPSEDGKYLVIKEWDVRFELPEELRGNIYYTPSRHQPDTMMIDSRDFPEGSECVSFGLIRTAEKVVNPTDPEGFNSSSIAQIDGYYYSRGIGIIACSNSEAEQNKAASIQRQLYEATGSIERAP